MCIHLESLPSGEARELAAALMERVPHAARVTPEVVAAEAGGHPLFIDVLVRHVLGDGHTPGSLKLDDALWARILALDEDARRLMELIAIAGAPLKQETAAVAGNARTFTRDVALLRAANLVRTTGARGADVIEPYHDRVRETVLQRLGPEARKASHQRLAVALEGASGADPEALSIHWRGAGDREKAARYAEKAARQAEAALAFARAARLYRQALELRGDTIVGRERTALYARLGDALAGAGRGGDAAAAYLEAAQGSVSESLELSRRAAEQLLKTGRLDEGGAVLERVLKAAGVKTPSTPRAALWSLLWCRARLRLRGIGFRERAVHLHTPESLTRIDVCWSAGIGLTPADFMRGGYFTSLHCLMALEAGEPYRVARALAGEAAISSTGGGASRRRTARLLDAASALAEKSDNPHARALVTLIAGVAAWCEGRFLDARRLGERAETVLRERCSGVSWELDQAQMIQLNALHQLGEMAELERRVPLVLGEAEERGDKYLTTSVRISLFTNAAWLVADDVARARAEAARAMDGWSREGFLLQHVNHLQTSTQIDLYAGDAQAAVERMTEVWPALERSLLLRVQPMRLGVLEARARASLAAARRGIDEARLVAQAEDDARRIARAKMPWSDPLARLIAAGVASMRGDSTEALRLADAAARGFDAADMSLCAAAARWRRGQLLGGVEGGALVAGADEWMRRQRIRSPARMTAMLAPGFED